MSAEEKKQGSGWGWVLGILFGLAVGVVLALLFAPQSGEETRAKLQEQREQFSNRYDDALDQGREAYSRARDEVMTRMKEQQQEAKVRA